MIFAFALAVVSGYRQSLRRHEKQLKYFLMLVNWRGLATYERDRRWYLFAHVI
nr:MAG TPA_asm: hypothetical protein [Caudoviricetes sp.]